MKSMVKALRIILLVSAVFAMTAVANSITSRDVVSFTITADYSNNTYGLCEDCSINIDTLMKYNPTVGEMGLCEGASVTLPADQVDMEILKEKGLLPKLPGDSSVSHNVQLEKSPKVDRSQPVPDKQNKQNKQNTTNVVKPTPVKQQVEAYCYDGHTIDKCVLFLEDDFAVGYRRKNAGHSYKRKPKIRRNPKSDPSKTYGDLTADYANHTYKYLDYYVYHPNEGPTMYFNLNITVPVIEEIVDNGIESSHSPVIKTDGSYLDPYANDGSHMMMRLKISGNRIIAYEDPFTKQFVECDISYRKKAEQPFGDYYDYTANVGKLVVNFLILKNVKDVYTIEEVDKEPKLKLDKSERSFDLARFLIENNNEKGNPNPLEPMRLSYIVNFDGVVSDVKVLESSDSTLNEAAVKALLRTKAEPAERELHKVNAQCSIELKVKRSMDNEQLFEFCQNAFEQFFNDDDRKEAIDYARRELSRSNNVKEISFDNASKRVKKLADFIDNIQIELRGDDGHYYYVIDSSEDWGKIEKSLFKNKPDNKKPDCVYIYLDGSRFYLKNNEDLEYVDYLFNKMNNKVYRLFLDALTKERYRYRRYIPDDFNELTAVYTKSQSDKDFEEYWKKELNILRKIDSNPQITDLISRWKEEFYYYKLGGFRNCILNEKREKVGTYRGNIEEWDYQYGNSVSRKYNFNNSKPYVLYPLQGRGYYNRIRF